jgi:hypothetical protein
VGSALDFSLLPEHLQKSCKEIRKPKRTPQSAGQYIQEEERNVLYLLIFQETLEGKMRTKHGYFQEGPGRGQG